MYIILYGSENASYAFTVILYKLREIARSHCQTRKILLMTVAGGYARYRYVLQLRRSYIAVVIDWHAKGIPGV